MASSERNGNITISRFLKRDVYARLGRALREGDVEIACYMSIELACTGPSELGNLCEYLVDIFSSDALPLLSVSCAHSSVDALFMALKSTQERCIPSSKRKGRGRGRGRGRKKGRTKKTDTNTDTETEVEVQVDTDIAKKEIHANIDANTYVINDDTTSQHALCSIVVWVCEALREARENCRALASRTDVVSPIDTRDMIGTHDSETIRRLRVSLSPTENELSDECLHIFADAYALCGELRSKECTDFVSAVLSRPSPVDLPPVTATEFSDLPAVTRRDIVWYFWLLVILSCPRDRREELRKTLYLFQFRFKKKHRKHRIELLLAAFRWLVDVLEHEKTCIRTTKVGSQHGHGHAADLTTTTTISFVERIRRLVHLAQKDIHIVFEDVLRSPLTCSVEDDADIPLTCAVKDDADTPSCAVKDDADTPMARVKCERPINRDISAPNISNSKRVVATPSSSTSTSSSSSSPGVDFLKFYTCVDESFKQEVEEEKERLRKKHGFVSEKKNIVLK
jgi:hypothetical protein